VRTVRWARRLCFATAAALTLLAAVGPTLAQALDDVDADRPIAWTGHASASGIHQNFDSEQGILPVKDPFFGNLPDAESNWGNFASDARASLYYPGPAGASGINLICDQVLSQAFNPDALPPELDDPLCNPAPKYPLIAQATAGTPDARVDTSQQAGTGFPATFTAVSAIAHAGRDNVSSDAVIAGLSSIGLPGMAPASLAFRRQAAAAKGGPAAAAAVSPKDTDPDTARVDSITSRTKQEYDPSGTLVVHAETALKHVSLLGGNVLIDSIFATSTSKTDGKDVNSHDEHITLGGVTVAGTPATIDETGIHVDGSSNAVNNQLNEGLAQLLSATGAEVKLLTTDGSAQQGAVESNAQGLFVYTEATLNIPNATDTYFFQLTLGTVGTTATATEERGVGTQLEEGGIGGLETPPAEVSAGSETAAPASFEPGTPAVPASAFNNTVRRPGRAAIRPGGVGGLLQRIEADLRGALISHRFDILYLAFTAAALGLALSSRLLVPRAKRTT
jgi:hypothetical protein